MTRKTLMHVLSALVGILLLGMAGLAGPMLALASRSSQAISSHPAAISNALAQATPTITPTVPITPTESSTEQTYVVQAGDTLWSIAAKFYGNGAKFTTLQRANNVTETSRLQVGTTLVIPSLADAAPTTLPKPNLTPTLALFPAPTTSTSTSFIPPVIATSAPPPITPDRVDTSAPNSNASNKDATSSLVQYVALAINILSATCLLGSALCAYMSLDAYRHARRFATRGHIRTRIRVRT